MKDGAGAERTDRPVAWTSDNEAVASVAAFTGVVTARSAGTATITAAVDGKTASATLTVTGVQAPANGPTAAFVAGCADLVCAFTDLSTGGDGSVDTFARSESAS